MNGNKITILLVEDDAIIALMERKQLEDKGYIVCHTDTGEQAVKVILEDKFLADLILMDINLGTGMDGTQAAEKILKKKDIPVVFLSSHTEPEVVEKTEKITSYGYVVKNSGIVVLDTSIKMAMKLYKAKIERKQIQKALEHSKRSYEAVYNASTDCIFIHDEETGDIIDVNQTTLDTLGYTKEEIKKLKIGDLSLNETPYTQKEALEYIRKAVKEGSQYFEWLSKKKSGELIWLENSLQCTQLAGKKRVLVVGRDISDRKKVQEKIEFQANLLQNIDQAAIATDLQGKVIFWNQAAEKIYGWTSEEAIGKNILSLTPTKQTKEEAVEIMKRLKEGKKWSGELFVKRKDGSSFIAHIVNSPIFDKKGNYIGIIGISSDITADKDAEENLKESYRRYRELFENSRDGFVVVDEKGSILDANQSYCEMLGYSLEELKKKEDFYEITPEKWRKWEFEEIWNNRLMTIGASGVYEKEYIRKNGEVFPVELQSFTVKHDKGNVLYLWGIARDISERKLMEKITKCQLKYEQAVSAASKCLLSQGISETAVTKALNALLEAFEVSRISIYENFTDIMDGLCMKKIHEVYLPEFMAEKSNPFSRHLVYDQGYERWRKVLESGNVIQGHTQDFPLEERKIFEVGGILSILIIPIFVEGQFWGMIDFEEIRYPRDWSDMEISLLRTAAEMFGTYFTNKRIENMLWENEQRLQAVFNAAEAVPVQGYNKNRQVVFWNPASEKLYGYSRSEAIGKTLEELIIPEEAQETVIELNRKWNEEGIPIPAGEIELISKYGKRLQVYSSHVMIVNHQGEKEMFCIDVDLTEQKQKEKQLYLLSLVLDQIQDLVTVTDLDGMITYVNKAEARFWGLSRSELTGTFMKNKGKNLNEGAAGENILDETFKKDSWRGEILDRDTEGKNIVLDCRTQLITDDQGNKVALAKVSTNITERKWAEQEIQKQLNEKEFLLREVHHRVKNNITNIEGLLSIQADSADNPEVKHALQDAVSRVQSMSILYNKLLLSKDYHEISIKNYIENLIDSLLGVFVLEDNIIIKKQISEFKILPQKAVSIGIIVAELLTNTFKYAFQDRKKGIIWIILDKMDNQVTLIIQDNGIGFDENAIEKKTPGLGIALVKMLVNQLNGFIEVTNQNGTKNVIQFEI